jgi:hypothetical protein
MRLLPLVCLTLLLVGPAACLDGSGLPDVDANPVAVDAAVLGPDVAPEVGDTGDEGADAAEPTPDLHEPGADGPDPEAPADAISSAPDGPTASDGARAPAVVRWRWENPLPQGHDILGIWGAGPNDVWAVGEHGLVLHFDGTSWTAVDVGTDANLTDVRGLAADDIYVAMGTDQLLHFDGTRWSRRTTGTGGRLKRLAGSGATLLAAGEPALVRRFDGVAWRDLSPAPPQTPSRIWAASPTELYIVVDATGRLWRFDGVWREVESDPLDHLWHRDVWGTGPADLYALTGGSRCDEPVCWFQEIRHFDGQSWTSVVRLPLDDFSHRLDRLAGSGPDHVVAFGAGTLRRDGDDWRPSPLGGGVTLGAGWVDASGALHGVGASGTLVQVNGDDVQPTHDGVLRPIVAAHGRGPDEAYGLTVHWRPSGDGAEGSILRWDGSHWTEGPEQALAGDTRCLWVTGPGEVTVVDAQGEHLLYRDGSWSNHGPIRGWAVGCTDIWGIGPELYVVGRGGVWRFDGQRWIELGPGISGGRLIWASGPDDVLVVGYRFSGPPGWFLARYDGTTWQESDLTSWGDPMTYTDMWGSGPDDVFVVGTGILHIDGASVVRPVGSGVGLTRLSAIWGEARDSVYAVGAGGTVIHWNGERWRSVPSTTTHELRAVWTSGAGEVRIFGALGAILRGERQP